MKIVSMEPTPSPYSMKVNVDKHLEDGQMEEYNATDDLTDVPQYVRDLFHINGIKGLFRVVDFITIERDPRVEWEEILPKVIEVIGSKVGADNLFSEAI